MDFLRRNAHWLGMAGVSLVAFGLVAAFFSFVLADPDDYFFLAGGDGLQSYFATAFYALYDKGTHFSGMNYPYGEHFLFPNLQPSIALVINFLQRLGIPAAAHTVGITNLVALAALAFTPVVLYAILRRLGLPVGYAALTALLIGFLSPQVDRLGGHMSLSYSCFVPMLWYCIVRMQQNPRQWRWYVLFGIGNLLMGLTMIYFLACGSLFLLTHALVLTVQERRFTPLVWRMVATALLPLLLFRGWMVMTDTVTDRPPNPYGLLTYMATPTGVFTPFLEPTRSWWQEYFPSEPNNPEAWSYVGMVATLVMGLTLLGGAWYLLRNIRKPRRWQRLWRPALPAPLRTGVWAGTLVLLVSLGLPFTLPGMDGLVDYIGPLKQLRALGRFAWPFYYTFCVYVAYYLYRLWRYQRRAWRALSLLRWVWLPLLLAIWAGEAWVNITAKTETVALGSGARNFLDSTTGLAAQLSWINRRADEFQAIMVLPHFNLGSDKIGLHGSMRGTYQAEKLALNTGLPLFSSYVSRPSVGQVLRNVQLLSSDMIEKTLLQQLPSAKPILLLTTADYLTPEQQRILSLARPLLTTADGTLYELPVAALAATVLAQERARAAALLPTLPVRAGGLQCTTAKGVLVEGFDQLPDRRGRLAPGAFYEPASAFSKLYDGPIPMPADTGWYEVSVWMNGKMDYSYGNLKVLQFANDQEIAQQVVDGHVATEVDGDWLRVIAPVRIRPGVNRLLVIYDNQDLLVDDLLIRPLDTDVYYYVGEGPRRKLVKNTYVLNP